jgi:hypothetical protein
MTKATQEGVVLAINCGSSSLKASIVRISGSEEERLAEANESTECGANLEGAISQTLAKLAAQTDVKTTVVAHRIVHNGSGGLGCSAPAFVYLSTLHESSSSTAVRLTGSSITNQGLRQWAVLRT